MQGADMAQHAHIYNEIMLPYAGIIRIRFMGMISASVSRGTPAVYFRFLHKVEMTFCHLERSREIFYSTNLTS